MDMDFYQKEARKTAVYPDVGNNLIYPAIGLAGETGEVMEKIKKMMRDDGNRLNDERREMIVKELGDVMWYVANLAAEIGVSLSEVAEKNLEKLRSRKERNVLHGDGDDR